MDGPHLDSVLSLSPVVPISPSQELIEALREENARLRQEIRVSRESAEITASLVVRQFEETERVLQRFQEANALRKAVLDSASNFAIMATDSDGIITVFNQGAENLLGYRGEEVIGAHTPLIFHCHEELRQHARQMQLEMDSGSLLDIFFQHAQKGRHRLRRWTYRRRDGSEFPVTLSINALRGPEGELSGLLCIASDISETIRSQMALEESERNYRLLINNIPNIVFKGYPDGTIEFLDDRIELLTGYSRKAFQLVRWADLVIEEDRPKVLRMFAKALKTGNQYINEYRIRKRDGKIAWIQATCQIVTDAQGKVDFISGTFLDITVRKKAEEAVLASEEMYRSLFASGPNPIFVLDPATLQILDVNPAGLEIYGYSKQEMLQLRFTDLGELEKSEPEQILHTPGNGIYALLVDQKARHRKKDGTAVFLRLKACGARFLNRDALILGATDITEMMEKDAQLFQASKMKTLGEMSAGIAHELNQPLNAIKIGNDYIQRILRQGQTLTAEELQRVSTLVSGQVQRASDIINRLRDFGRKPDYKNKPVNLNNVLADVMKIIGQQLQLNNVKVAYRLAPVLPSIMANANRLEQVFFNLINNARDAIEQRSASVAGSPGVITLRTGVDRDAVWCRVQDNGVGIAEAHREKIFEPFFTTKEVGKGMGLGLAITYGIVRDFGGTISLPACDHGASVEVRFPIP